LNDTTIDGQRGADLEAVQHFEHPPETDAVSIFMPCPIWDVGHRRTTGRRREDRARHGVTRIPFLDIHDYPHHQASTAWQHEPRPVVYRRIRNALGREHRHISFQPAENITNMPRNRQMELLRRTRPLALPHRTFRRPASNTRVRWVI